MFSEILKSIRKSCGLSQRALADLVGVNFTYISKLENNRLDPPSEELLIKMAQAFKMDRYQLIFYAGKIPKEVHAMIVEDAKSQSWIMLRYFELLKEHEGK